MAPLGGLKVVIGGAGVFGLACGLELSAAGADVQVYDPSGPEDSASGVAAGMLAPAFESAMDPLAANHFALLRSARDAWPGFIERGGLAPELVERSGALFVSDDQAAAAEMLTRLASRGAEAEVLGRARAEALVPGLSLSVDEVVFTPEDWRLGPAAALHALRSAFARTGGRIEPSRLTWRGGRMANDRGEPVRSDVTVICAGAEAAALSAAAPELGELSPIKGQLLQFAGGPRRGAVVRTPRGYIAPQELGAVSGATMEPGRSDRTVEPATLERLRAEAERLFPALMGVEAWGRAGVRGATPDGLPMVGRSVGPGEVWLAVGARRNGWLLAPLVAELLSRQLVGQEVGLLASTFAPGRFRIS